MDDHIYPGANNNLYSQRLFYSITHQDLNKRMG